MAALRGPPFSIAPAILVPRLGYRTFMRTKVRLVMTFW